MSNTIRKNEKEVGRKWRRMNKRDRAAFMNSQETFKAIVVKPIAEEFAAFMNSIGIKIVIS